MPTISIGSYSFRVEILLLIGFLTWVMWGSVLCSCSRVNSFQEGFDIAFGDSGPKIPEVPPLAPSVESPPDSASIPGAGATLEFSAGQEKLFGGDHRVLSEPAAQLNYFAATGTKFSHECCPSTYSTDQGCACV